MFCQQFYLDVIGATHTELHGAVQIHDDLERPSCLWSPYIVLPDAGQAHA